MNNIEAINVLIQGVEIGRKNAVYSFDDAALISQAIHTLMDENEQPTNTNEKELDDAKNNEQPSMLKRGKR